MLQTLVNNGRLVTNKCDDILHQFTDVVSYAILPTKDEFASFDPFNEGQRVDVFLEGHMNASDKICGRQ